jgi:hypothetical protein
MKLNTITTHFICLIIGIMLGYIWCSYHNTNNIIDAIQVGEERVLHNIFNEAKAGTTFWYGRWKIIPRKDGGVTIK